MKINQAELVEKMQLAEAFRTISVVAHEQGNQRVANEALWTAFTLINECIVEDKKGTD